MLFPIAVAIVCVGMLYISAVALSKIQHPPLLLAPVVKMSKYGYKKFTIW